MSNYYPSFALYSLRAGVLFCKVKFRLDRQPWNNTNPIARKMNIIKQKALHLLENAFGKTGTVLAIRAWEPATFFEVDVHFPEMDMSGWKRVQHIKVRVGEGI